MYEVKNKKIWEEDRVFTAACVAYFVVLVLFITVRIISALGWLDGLSDEVIEVGFSVVSQVVIMFLIPFFAMKFFSRASVRETAQSFGFTAPTGRVVWVALGLGALLYLFNIFVAGFFNGILSMLGYRFPSSDMTFMGFGGFLISILLIAVLPGFCEEANHRGMLLNSFMHKLGVWKAVILSSVIFGLMHLNIVQFFYATILGYIICIAVLATRSIWTGIIMHFMNNGIGVYLQYAQEHRWPMYNILDPVLDIFSQPYGMLLFFATMYLLYFVIMEIIQRAARKNYKENEKLYFAKFLSQNPKFVAEQNMSMDDMAVTVDRYVAQLGRHQALRFYLEGQRKAEGIGLVNRTLVFGIIFLGSIITAFTFVWGLL